MSATEIDPPHTHTKFYLVRWCCLSLRTDCQRLGRVVYRLKTNKGGDTGPASGDVPDIIRTIKGPIHPEISIRPHRRQFQFTQTENKRAFHRKSPQGPKKTDKNVASPTIISFATAEKFTRNNC